MMINEPERRTLDKEEQMPVFVSSLKPHMEVLQPHSRIMCSNEIVLHDNATLWPSGKSK